MNAGKGFVGAAPLPVYVDHRTDGTEGPVRFQEEVGACTAFSLSAAIDHAFTRLSGRVMPVSVMHVWSRYHFPDMDKAAEGNLGHGLTVESAWQYDKKLACAWDCIDSCHPALLVDCASPDPVRIQSADSLAAVAMSNVTRLDALDLDSIKEALAKGQDVWFAMYADPNAFGTVHGSNSVIPDGKFRGGPSHAMLLAGYTVQSNGTYYLIHNSWGEDWGDRGYAWIYESTLRNNIISAYLVEVGAASSSGAQPPTKPVPLQPTCPADSKPDSALGVCAPACPDGSPRNSNACPIPNQCPAGYVNLTGLCVVAAPTVAGRDAQTGITYNCASGGCTYGIPLGQAGCVSLPYCAESCPAPNFHLTINAVGAGCAD
ncbi:MAG: C1 family peptidase [Polyangiaceae bacterium]